MTTEESNFERLRVAIFGPETREQKVITLLREALERLASDPRTTLNQADDIRNVLACADEVA